MLHDTERSCKVKPKAWHVIDFGNGEVLLTVASDRLDKDEVRPEGPEEGREVRK